jgi:hypothetical protein
MPSKLHPAHVTQQQQVKSAEIQAVQLPQSSFTSAALHRKPVEENVRLLMGLILTANVMKGPLS